MGFAWRPLFEAAPYPTWLELSWTRTLNDKLSIGGIELFSPKKVNSGEVMVILTIDTCVINSKGKLSAMNKLEQWHDEEKIQLDVTDIMENESTPESLQWHKQGKYVFQLLKPDKIKYPLRFNVFKNILFSSVKILNKRQKMDINQICTHLKYGNDFFVTNDMNFVRHRGELEKNDVTVLTPVECVEALRRKFGWA